MELEDSFSDFFLKATDINLKPTMSDICGISLNRGDEVTVSYLSKGEEERMQGTIDGNCTMDDEKMIILKDYFADIHYFYVDRIAMQIEGFKRDYRFN